MSEQGVDLRLYWLITWQGHHEVTPDATPIALPRTTAQVQDAVSAVARSVAGGESLWSGNPVCCWAVYYAWPPRPEVLVKASGSCSVTPNDVRLWRRLAAGG